MTVFERPMRRIILSLTLIFAQVLIIRAQDPNFSQFFASPLTLNPALTGKFDGSVRVAGNYRNQWPTIENAFITKTVSLDFADEELLCCPIKLVVPSFPQIAVILAEPPGCE